MAIVKRISRQAPPAETPAHNPYEMVPVVIGGVETVARPYRFDVDPDKNTMLGPNGQPVRPTHLSTSCAVCGNGIDIVVAEVYRCKCEACGAAVSVPSLTVVPPVPEMPFDPFVNPLSLGRLTYADLEAGVGRPDELAGVLDDDQTVAEQLRLAAPTLVTERIVAARPMPLDLDGLDPFLDPVASGRLVITPGAAGTPLGLGQEPS